MSADEREEYQDKYKPLLDKLFNQVSKDLKRKMFPRKHRKLLYRSIEVDNKILGAQTIGRYMVIEKSEYDYSHKIIIDSKIILDYLTAVPGCKRYYLYKLKDTIAHELIHAYVKEQYGFINESSLYDGSPIFLSILTYLNIKSGHPAMKSFVYTKLCKKVKKCNTFKELEVLLINELENYQSKFKELNEIIDNGKRLALVNEFTFSFGKVTGIKGLSTITMEYRGIFAKANIFEVGVFAEIDNIKDLIVKKARNNTFDNKYFSINKKEAIKLQTLDI